MVRHASTGWNLLMAGADRLDGGTGTSPVGQNQGKEYWVLKKVEVCWCGQLW
jgi:hypothetical protein